MANSTNILTDNTTTPLAKGFLKGFEASRVLTKTVNTQLLQGKINPSSGSTADFKRPHDYKSDRTSTGDISAVDKSDIVAAKATGTVQEYFTVHADWDEFDEATSLDELDKILAPMATRLVTDLELDLGSYMYKNCNLHVGTPGTPVDAWSDVANAGALMDSMGVPNEGMRNYVMNPYSAVNLASAQSGLAGGADSLINTAWQNAQIASPFGGLKAVTSNALSSYTSGLLSAGANRAGTLSANPDVTYVTNKDTMTQSLAVTGFGAGVDTISAGEIVEITGRNRLSLSTRSAFTNSAGGQVLWSGVVTADVTLAGGAGTIVVAGPAIYEANGQYNTVDSAPLSGDVITIINPAASTVYQPSMFYHQQAFGLGTVQLKKLYATDTIATTEDGMQIRVSRYSDGDANKQKVRFDLLPAYATFNPFFAGQGFGI